MVRSGISETDECKYCNEIDTVEHTFFECPTWASERQQVESNYHCIKAFLNAALPIGDFSGSRNPNDPTITQRGCKQESLMPTPSRIGPLEKICLKNEL
ncbi:hypothetical protein Trydic_g7040 [Trypoxylus dichotomus]